MKFAYVCLNVISAWNLLYKKDNKTVSLKNGQYLYVGQQNIC